MSDEKECFVISPIGDEGSDTRERSNKMLEFIIEPAVEPHGFKAIRADQIDEPGMITTQIINRVVESPLVIADLTGSNANVFYELAVRHAYQKPFIQLINNDENIPFDIAGTRTIKIDLSDLESAERAKTEIGEQIQNIESDDQDIDTPLSVALDLKNLKESTDPEERSLGEIMESISELRTNMKSIENKLGDPEELLPPEYINELSRRINMKQDKRALLLVSEIDSLVNYLYGKMQDESIDEPELEEIAEDLHNELMKLRDVLQSPQPEIVRELDDYF